MPKLLFSELSSGSVLWNKSLKVDICVWGSTQAGWNLWKPAGLWFNPRENNLNYIKHYYGSWPWEAGNGRRGKITWDPFIWTIFHTNSANMKLVWFNDWKKHLVAYDSCLLNKKCKGFFKAGI